MSQGASALNGLLRFLTLAIRGLMVLLFARHLEPSDLGAFAVIATGVSFSLLALGMDFYVYANRQMSAADPDKVRFIALNQVAFLTAAYLVVGPLALFAAKESPELSSQLGWFAALTLLEHLNQELGRIMQILGEITLSSLLLFVRSALWVIVLVPLFEVVPHTRTLVSVLLAWTAMSTASLLVGFAWFIGRYGRRGYGRIDPTWISKGLATGGLYLLSTLLFRAIAAFDRFAVEGMGGTSLVAQYTLAMTIGMVIPNVVDPATMMYALPVQIRAAMNGDHAAFKTTTMSVARSAILMVVPLVGVALIAGTQLDRLLGNPKYAIPTPWLVLALAAGVLYCIALLPHYVLYATGKDRDVLLGNVIGFSVFGAFGLAAVQQGSVMVLMSGIVASYGSMFIAKGLLATKAWMALRDRSQGAPTT